MTTYHEPVYLSDVLLTEVARGWTTQNVKVKTDVALKIGTVLYLNFGKNYFSAETSDYSGAVGVLADNVKPSDEIQTVLAIVRGAVVAKENLIFPSNANDEQKKLSLEILNDHKGIATWGETLPIVAPTMSPPKDVDSAVPLVPEPIIEEDEIPYAD